MEKETTGRRSPLLDVYSGLSDIDGDAYAGGTVSTEEALGKKWKVYEPGRSSDPNFPDSEMEWGGRIEIEDMGILTEDGGMVLGSSEWMCSNRGVFEHIVALHNSQLEVKG